MRQSVLPLAALLLALAGGQAFAAPDQPAADKPTRAKAAPAKPAPAKANPEDAAAAVSRSKSELKPLGVPGVKETILTPEQVKAQQAEWKKLEAQQLAERKVRREKLKGILAGYEQEGLDFKRGDKPGTYRLIAPSVAQTADPAKRKALAKALVARIKGQVEPLLNKKIAIEVYPDAKATQPIRY